MKQRVAEEIAKRIRSGEKIGLGTGSTVALAIDAINKRVLSEKLSISLVPSSLQSAWGAAGANIISPVSAGPFDWGFDGADEVDPEMNLIKGLGGALLQEKILAAKCKKFIVIVDESKLVKKLGEKTAVPVEVIPTATYLVMENLKKIGGDPILRLAVKKHGPVITEAGNVIIDVRFQHITRDVADQLKLMTGVVEHGIFCDLATEILIAKGDGVYSMSRDSNGKVLEKLVTHM